MKHLVTAAAAILLIGSLATSALAASDSATYIYDALGRVTQVTFTNGTTTVYTYDSAGNRTNVVTTCSGSGC